ncbi:zinc-binding protein A33-like isoform X2 [Scyliorhinus canicula]|uniref:zinc-binding protein A33-like isoform X2 n=1 Tax=Scyliorhinus canicula TaxID=7830 RepID=UPI0018F5287B|nr:zinc-binding protein A33-like isoform X2 [Scyliorhinus canicula]
MASRQEAESLTEEAICPVCLDFFVDPVILDCGHNFCRSCITQCCKKKINSCPECRERIPKRNLKINRALANLAEKARNLSMNQNEKENKLHCEEHQEELKLFCETDKKLICVICRDSWEHKDHCLLSVKKAAEIYRDQRKSSLDSLRENKKAVLKTEQKQKRKISEVREQSSSLQTRIAFEFSKMHQILTEKEQRLLRDLREEEERILETMEKNLQEIQENLISIEEKLSNLQKQVEQKDELTILKVRINEGNHTPSVANVDLSIRKFNGPLQYTVWREMLDSIDPAPVSLTLDPNQMNSRLIFSSDHSSVRFGNEPQRLSGSPETFHVWPFVLGSQGFTSGRHYWEVEVGKKTQWIVGVARESVNREGRMDLSPENGYWTVWLEFGNYYFAVTSPSLTPLTQRVNPHKIGVYLNYEDGQVSFYNADNMSHLHTYTHAFTERIFPFFHPGWNIDGKNSAPLKICGIKGH